MSSSDYSSLGDYSNYSNYSNYYSDYSGNSDDNDDTEGDDNSEYGDYEYSEEEDEDDNNRNYSINLPEIMESVGAVLRRDAKEIFDFIIEFASLPEYDSHVKTFIVRSILQNLAGNNQNKYGSVLRIMNKFGQQTQTANPALPIIQAATTTTPMTTTAATATAPTTSITTTQPQQQVQPQQQQPMQNTTATTQITPSAGQQQARITPDYNALAGTVARAEQQIQNALNTVTGSGISGFGRRRYKNCTKQQHSFYL